MTANSRQEFIKRPAVSGVAGFLVANAAELGANPPGLPIGSQAYPLRTQRSDPNPRDEAALRRELPRIAFDAIKE